MGSERGAVGRTHSESYRGTITLLILVGVVVVVAAVGSAFAVATTTVWQDHARGPTALSVQTVDGADSFTRPTAEAPVVGDAPLVVEVANDGVRQATYSVVLVRERVYRQDDLVVVATATIVDRREVVVGAGATHRFEYDSREAGDAPTRLRAYLYRGDAPEIPSPGSADLVRQGWIEPLPPASAE